MSIEIPQQATTNQIDEIPELMLPASELSVREQAIDNQFDEIPELVTPSIDLYVHEKVVTNPIFLELVTRDYREANRSTLKLKMKMMSTLFSENIVHDSFNDAHHFCLTQLRAIDRDESEIMSLTKYHEVIDFMIQEKFYLEYVSEHLAWGDRLLSIVPQMYMLSKMRSDEMLNKELTLGMFRDELEWLTAACKRILTIFRENIRTVKPILCCDNTFEFDGCFDMDPDADPEATYDICAHTMLGYIECTPVLFLYFSKIASYNEYAERFMNGDVVMIDIGIPQNIMWQLGNVFCTFLGYVSTLSDIKLFQNNMLFASRHHLCNQLGVDIQFVPEKAISARDFSRMSAVINPTDEAIVVNTDSGDSK
jgi:hypothetical protein